MNEHQAREKFDALVETSGVIGVFAVGLDGFLMHAINVASADPEGVAALSALAMEKSAQFGNGLNLGSLSWSLAEFSMGKLLMVQQFDQVWVVLADKSIVLGSLLAKIRQDS